MPAAVRRTPILLDMLSFVAIFVAICVGVIEMWNLAMDKSRLEQDNDDDPERELSPWAVRIQTSYTMTILMVNFIMIFAFILDSYLLVTLWIFVYSFLVIYHACKYISSDSGFSWNEVVRRMVTVTIVFLAFSTMTLVNVRKRFITALQEELERRKSELEAKRARLEESQRRLTDLREQARVTEQRLMEARARSERLRVTRVPGGRARSGAVAADPHSLENGGIDEPPTYSECAPPPYVP